MQDFKKITFSLIELLVGILIAGVSQFSCLLSVFRLNNTRTLTQISSVSGILDIAV